MIQRRVVIAGVAGAVMVVATAGLLARRYWSAEAYRRRVAESVSTFFQLPCDIAEALRRPSRDAEFKDVVLWLPTRAERVFDCKRALWLSERGTAAAGITLELMQGAITLGTDQWRMEDYRRVIESGLRHERIDLRRVRLTDFSISFRRGTLALAVADADGSIDYDTPEVGIASLAASELNGQRVRQPIQIYARLRTQAASMVEYMVLTIPEIALSGLGVVNSAGAPVTRGSFSGRIEYQDAQPEPRVTLSGRLTDVALAELTRTLPGGVIRGTATILLDHAEFTGTLPTRVRGQARVSGVPLADLARAAGAAPLHGEATLAISEAEVAEGRIERLVLSGSVADAELQETLRPLGRGSATGRLSVDVNVLRIENNRIVCADAEIRVSPAVDAPGLIDRDLLLSAAEQLGGLTWPEALPRRLLPERIEYLECGARLLVKDNRLRILGSHGDGGRSILTVRALGRAWSVVGEPEAQLDLTPWIDALPQRLSMVDPRELRDRLRQQTQRGATNGAP